MYWYVILLNETKGDTFNTTTEPYLAYFEWFIIWPDMLHYGIIIRMASCTSGLTHIKKTMKIYVVDGNNLINITVSHSGLDYLVTDFVTFLC